MRQERFFASKQVSVQMLQTTENTEITEPFIRFVVGLPSDPASCSRPKVRGYEFFFAM
jgi:hypothetical protein